MEKNKGTNKNGSMISVYTIQPPLPLTVPEKSVAKDFNVLKLERKKNEK